MIPQNPILILITLLLFLILIRVPVLSAEVSISVTPKTLAKSGDPVTVRWTGVQSPSKLDWLGIYSPSNSSNKNFIGYFFLSSSPGWESGSGSISLPLVNLRSEYQFRLFRWFESEINPKHHDNQHNPLPGSKHLLAVSENVGFEKGRGPEQIHLAYTGQVDEMRVMFVTPDGKESSVKYGLYKDKMDQAVGTRVLRYEKEDMCDFPANSSVGWRDPGYIHDGVMNKLKPGKRYYYQVGSNSSGWSLINSFVAHDGDSSEVVAFLYGDMGTATPYSTFLRTQDESMSTVKWISRDIEDLGDKPTLISHIGDISYARGYAWLWDNFFTQIEPIASKVPYHVCIGNHEYAWPLQPWRPDWSYGVYGKDGGGECGVPYSLRFTMPGNSSEVTGTHAPATRNLYYSFDLGPVHFVYISTETDFLNGSNQFKFLKHDLESVDRTRTPFVVVQGHRPMYTTSNVNRDAPHINRMIEHLEPLLVNSKVNLALWGHVHRYERFCPLNNFTCGTSAVMNTSENSKGYTVHVVIGMAGQDGQPARQPRPNHPDDPIFPQPSISMYRGGEFGYTRLVGTREKLTLSYVGNHDGEVHDMVEIMASGQVIDGGGISDIVGTKRNGASALPLCWYVGFAILLMLGAFIGYVFGFISHCRREASESRNWIPVKNDYA